MALRPVIFRNMDTGEELPMPVVPGSFDVEEGRRVETLDMAGAGHVNLPGLESLFNKAQEFLLPARNAAYVTGGWQRPYDIIEKLTKWSHAGNVVRYIIYGTAVNAPVLIETVRYREQDGTNDVYLTLTLKKYRYLAAESSVVQARSTDNDPRPDEGQAVSETSYTVQQGDCLWTIAQKYYGDGSLCYRLATYNNIPNSFLIRAGDVLEIPDVSVIKATAQTLPNRNASEDAYKKSLAEKVAAAARERAWRKS